MGACRSKLSRQDQQLARAAEFVRHASQGDLASLKLMLKKRRVDVNAQDVRVNRLSLLSCIASHRSSSVMTGFPKRFGMTALHWGAFVKRRGQRQGLQPSC